MAGEVPIGTVVAFGGLVDGDSPDSSPPPVHEAGNGWLLCNGAELEKSAYPKLFAAIQYAHGRGAGTNFKLLDLRGMFLRGVDRGRGIDPQASKRIAPIPGVRAANSGNDGDRVGSVQRDTVGRHGHGIDDPGHSHAIKGYVNSGGPPLAFGAAGFLADGFRSGHESTGLRVKEHEGSESRPKNAYVNFIIRAT